MARGVLRHCKPRAVRAILAKHKQALGLGSAIEKTQAVGRLRMSEGIQAKRSRVRRLDIQLSIIEYVKNISLQRFFIMI